MTWIIGTITFICATIAFFCTGLFVISCISSVINPQLRVENGEMVDKNQNSRLIFLIIAAITWAIVIAL
jgi:hypothetical protein